MAITKWSIASGCCGAPGGGLSALAAARGELTDRAADDGTDEDYIPFFVRPPRGATGRRDRPKLAFLAPTAAYMAYANHQEHLQAEAAESVIGRLLVFQPTDGGPPVPMFAPA